MSDEFYITAILKQTGVYYIYKTDEFDILYLNTNNVWPGLLTLQLCNG